MNVILRRGERNTAACFPLLVPLYPFLPPTYSLRTRLDPSCSPSSHYHLLSSINFHHVNLPTSPSFLYPGSYVSPKSTHNYKTFNLNVKLKRNGFSSVSTVAIKNPRSVFPVIAHRFAILEKNGNKKIFTLPRTIRFCIVCNQNVFMLSVYVCMYTPICLVQE